MLKDGGPQLRKIYTYWKRFRLAFVLIPVILKLLFVHTELLSCRKEY
jgi:hypothetical protein